MIQFNELKIDPHGKCLIVDASVVASEYFERRHITDIYVDSDLTFVSATTPSDSSIHIEIEDQNLKEYYKQFSVAELASLIKPEEQDIKRHIFFVFIVIDGVVSGVVPCGMDKDMYLGVAINWDLIYHQSINYMKTINKCCEIPKEYIDYILRVKGLELAVRTGNFDVVLHMWNKFFNNRFIHSNSVCCGCN